MVDLSDGFSIGRNNVHMLFDQRSSSHVSSPGAWKSATPQSAQSCPIALFLLRRRRGRRTFTHDQENGVFVLGAIPMYLFAEVRDKASRRHRRGVGRIEFRSRTNPPSALQHGDETVVGVEVGRSEEHTSELQSPCNLVCRL